MELLPQPWPAERAQELFHRLHAGIEVQTRAEVARVLDTIPVTEGEQDADGA